MRQVIYVWVATLILLLSGCASAPQQNDGIHRIVIQVSTDDPRTQTMALNNAINIKKSYNDNNVKVEIVAYGPGLSMLMATSKQARRVKSLAVYEEFTFNACNNTMQAIKRKVGKMPRMVEGISIVPSGVVYITELQEKGYSYIRP